MASGKKPLFWPPRRGTWPPTAMPGGPPSMREVVAVSGSGGPGVDFRKHFRPELTDKT
jgi:hypothetical protein